MWFVIELVPGNELKHLFTVEEANAPMLRTMGLYPNLLWMISIGAALVKNTPAVGRRTST
jgi:hypothetical protein